MDKIKDIYLFTELMKEGSELIIYSLPFYEEADITLAKQYINIFMEYLNDKTKLDELTPNLKLILLKYKDYLKNIFRRFLNSSLRLNLVRSNFLKIFSLVDELYFKLSIYDKDVSVNKDFEMLRIHNLYIPILISDSNFIRSNLDTYEEKLTTELISYENRYSKILLKVKEVKQIQVLNLELELNLFGRLNKDIKLLTDDFLELINDMKRSKDEGIISVNGKLSNSNLENISKICRYYLDAYTNLC